MGRVDYWSAARKGGELDGRLDEAPEVPERRRRGDAARSVQRGETDGTEWKLMRGRGSRRGEARRELVAMPMRGADELGHQEKQATEDGGATVTLPPYLQHADDRSADLAKPA